MKDFRESCVDAWPGFQLIDYEQHKGSAYFGGVAEDRLNEQAVVGNGQAAADSINSTT